jgi:hypothetical protein
MAHPFAALVRSAIAITFWYGGTKPGIVAVLLASLIRGFIFEGETSRLSRVLYEPVFLTFAHDLGQTEEGGSRARDHGFRLQSSFS